MSEQVLTHTGKIDIMVSYWNIMDPLYNAKSIFRYFPGSVLCKFWLKLFLMYNICFLPWYQEFLEFNGQHTETNIPKRVSFCSFGQIKQYLCGNCKIFCGIWTTGTFAFRMFDIKHFNVINSNLNHEVCCELILKVHWIKTKRCLSFEMNILENFPLSCNWILSRITLQELFKMWLSLPK